MVGTVGGNDDLSNVETFGQSGYQIEDAAAFENTHYYQKAGGNQPYTGMANTVANHAAISSDPLVITETGYATVITTPTDYNPLDPWEGVDEATQAKLTLNSLFDATLLGVHSVYLYQLFDGAAPTSQNANKPAAHLGLFGYLPVGDTDWLATAKQSAIALHNLTTVLNGTSDPFSGPALTYSVSGLPAGGAALALDKTSGVKDIVLWAEPDIWDQVNDQAITVTPTDATVSFNGSTVNVRIYDPMLGEAAILTYSNVTSVTVAATDHPVIVEVVSGQIVNGTDTGNKLFGGTGADLLNGLGGADTLDGGAGSDRMVGGLGGDIYIVDNADDQVVENVAEGTDTVKASLSYALVDNVEKLTLTGTGAINGTGNAVANTIIGNDGDNVLNGRGNNDVLTGGLGADTFVFDVLETSANKDTIKDFVSGTDHIAISVAAFGGLAAYGLGTLDASELAYGTGATTADQHLVYNTGTGGLYYDADGVGGTAQVQLALLSLQPVLLASDIVLI